VRFHFSPKGAIIAPLAGLLMALLLAGCGDNPTATIAPTTPATTAATTLAVVSPTIPATTVPATTAPRTATAIPPTPTVAPPTATLQPQPTATAIPPTLTPQPANLPPRYIDALRARSYNGSEIKLDRLYEQNQAYTAHLIYYQSDGLRISGLMMVPNGPKDRKYPVALVNHGYFDPPDYDSGWDTVRELRFFARNGYITIASDYRNYARSDKGDNDRQPGYILDILNLIEAAKKLPQADPSKITIMGHSMGGEITLNALVINKDIKVAALFGSMSADAADNFYARIKWRGGDTPEKSIYGDPAQNTETYRRMSPLTYFPDITAPVIIHSGTNDTTTPPAWSEKIFKSLQSLNKTTEFYSYPGQGHSLNGAAFDTAMSRTLTFFNKALGI
jgi:dipeptidyl aminopeptidase/acylaminoacyl peptidase